MLFQHKTMLLAFSSLLLLQAAMADDPRVAAAKRACRLLYTDDDPFFPICVDLELQKNVRFRRELSTSESAFLLEDESCKDVLYDVYLYIDRHVYMAGIPSNENKTENDLSSSSACPFLAMEASDPAWKQDGDNTASQGLQKHIHEVSLPGNIDPRKFFDLLPLGTFPLSELLQAYEESTASTPQDAIDTENYDPIFSDGSNSPKNYDLVLANCGELAVQMGSRLGIKSSRAMTDYTVRRLLKTYEGIADNVRSNDNVMQLSSDNMNEISDEDVVRHLVGHRFRRLGEDAEETPSPSSSGGNAKGIPCGKWYSKDCIGDDDIRYASDASDNLADQATLWTVLPGYYEADSYSLGPDGNKIPPSPIGEEGLSTPSSFPYSLDSFKMFLNITVSGTRYFEHAYQIFPPAPEDFCNETLPEGTKNVDLLGECGVTGMALGGDRYGTSSYERDGSLLMLPFGATWLDTERIIDSYVTTPVNEKTGFTSFSVGGRLYQYSVACFDDACSGLSLVSETFDITDPEKAVLVQTIRRTARRIDTADEFVDRINQVYEDFNVLPLNQFPAPMITKESEADCLSEICPTDLVWCESDPSCSASPYQEPAGSLKPGIYVLIVFVVLALNSLVFGFAAMRFIKKRENALKEKFAVRIAESIKVEGEDRVLTAENIAEEFKKIDVDGSGMVNKAELFEFIQTGKAGKKISESDFESLFAAIDLDKNGEIDFGEFVSFFQKCQDKYEEVKDQPSVRRNRMSYAPHAMK